MTVHNEEVVSKRFDVEFDQGRHPKGKIGFVLLATEQTIVDDMIRLMPQGVGIHFARVYNPDAITQENLLAIAPELTRAAKTLLPDGSLDVVTYACTSGSLILGENAVHGLLNLGAPNAKATCIIAAVTRALRAVGAKKLIVTTPYLDEVNTLELKFLRSVGFEVLEFEGMNIENDSDMVKVNPRFIRDMTVALDRPDADAIFVSCGALRSIDVIEEIEEVCGKPVITSNQAMAWDALRLAGIDERVAGFGALLRNH